MEPTVIAMAIDPQGAMSCVTVNVTIDPRRHWLFVARARLGTRLFRFAAWVTGCMVKVEVVA